MLPYIKPFVCKIHNDRLLLKIANIVFFNHILQNPKIADVFFIYCTLQKPKRAVDANMIACTIFFSLAKISRIPLNKELTLFLFIFTLTYLFIIILSYSREKKL